MSAPPAVSVYMPAYNVARFVRQAAESILAQTFGDFEFIIIDDGSTDDTLAVLKELAARDRRIQLVSRPNAGVSATANESIALARGEFLARLDGDDVALPQRLEKQVAHLRAHPDCVAVGSNALMMDEDGLPLYLMPDVQFGHEKIEAGFWRGGWPMVQPACTYRRDAVRAVGGYRRELSLHEDHDLFLRLAEHGKLDNLPDVLIWYRQRLGSLTFGESATSRKVIAGILSEARKRRGLPDPPDSQAGSGEAPVLQEMLSRCRKWAWMSLKARHVATARKYAKDRTACPFFRRFVEADVLCAAREIVVVNAIIGTQRPSPEHSAPRNVRSNGSAPGHEQSPADATMTQTAGKTPTISVLMPVYNAGEHLREAMDSILAQTFGDYEFLCVNDGSTDDSPRVLGEYADRDPRIVIITKPNGGVTSALNAGLKVARGEFVARMDADDIADPQRFQSQLEHMRADPVCVAVGCRVTHMTARGVDISVSPLIATHEEIAASLWNGNSSAMPHFGSFIRRAALSQIGNYREEFRTAQDLDLFLRLSEVGKLGNVPRSLMRYRVHEGSVGARKTDEQARNAREILRQAYERRGLKLPRHLAKWKNINVAINRQRWGWQALEEGRFADARGHAWSVLRRRPFRKQSWKLAFHALLGPMRPMARSVVRGLRRSKPQAQQKTDGGRQ